MPPPGLGKPFEDDESGAKKVLADGEKARRDEQAKAAGVVPGQGPRRKPRVNMEDIEDLWGNLYDKIKGILVTMYKMHGRCRTCRWKLQVLLAVICDL